MNNHSECLKRIFPLIGREAAAMTVREVLSDAYFDGRYADMSEITAMMYRSMMDCMYGAANASLCLRGTGETAVFFRRYLADFPSSKIKWYEYIREHGEAVLKTSEVIADLLDILQTYVKKGKLFNAVMIFEQVYPNAQIIYDEADLELRKLCHIVYEQ